MNADFLSGGDGLASVVIPNSVTSIGSTTFHFCVGLTNIVIPESVTNIGVGAFSITCRLPSSMAKSNADLSAPICPPLEFLNKGHRSGMMEPTSKFIPVPTGDAGLPLSQSSRD